MEVVVHDECSRTKEGADDATHGYRNVQIEGQ